MRSFIRSTPANILVLAGSANRELAVDIARNLGAELGKLDVARFADGEIKVVLPQSVRNTDVYLIQPTSAPANDNLMELCLTVDALRRASAGRITTVIPYFGYQRQEKQLTREPISAKFVANMIELAGADHVILLDVHANAMQGFFDIPVELLTAARTMAHAVQDSIGENNFVVVSPDAGGVARAKKFASYLSAPLAIVHKERPNPDVAEVVAVVGDVEGRHCIIVDDLISTGSTLINAARALKEKGALAVSVAATHGVFADGAIQRLQDSVIDHIYVTNSVPLRISKEQQKDCPKLHVVNIAPVVAETIERVHEGESVRALSV